MDLNKEAFEFCCGPATLILIFSPETAKSLVDALTCWIQNHNESDQCKRFYIAQTGSIIDCSSFIAKQTAQGK